MNKMKNDIPVKIDAPGSYSSFNRIGKILTFKYPCAEETVCAPFEVVFPSSYIQIECWGAGGGSSKSNPAVEGGKGGYSRGIIHIRKDTTLFLYVGAQGKPNGNSTFNGGARGSIRSGDGLGQGGGSGGGGTDVRLVKGTTIESLRTRIIVAGGGAGSEMYRYPNHGGYGGGYQGGNGNITTYTEIPIGFHAGTGGTLLSGGRSSSGQYGTLGNASDDGPIKYGSGGGGGYYGGGSGSSVFNNVATGGGGSSFISGIDNCSVVFYNQYNYSFHSGNTIPGNEEMPLRSHPSVNGTEPSSDGMIRITILYVSTRQSRRVPFLYTSFISTFFVVYCK